LLQNRQLGELKFRRQHVIDGFVVDFYCVALRFAIEVDGDVHEERRAEDAKRDAILKSRGIEVFRIANRDVLENPRAAAARILGAIRKFPATE